MDMIDVSRFIRLKFISCKYFFRLLFLSSSTDNPLWNISLSSNLYIYKNLSICTIAVDVAADESMTIAAKVKNAFAIHEKKLQIVIALSSVAFFMPSNEFQ